MRKLHGGSPCKFPSMWVVDLSALPILTSIIGFILHCFQRGECNSAVTTSGWSWQENHTSTVSCNLKACVYYQIYLYLVTRPQACTNKSDTTLATMVRWSIICQCLLLSPPSIFPHTILQLLLVSIHDTCMHEQDTVCDDHIHASWL